MITRRTFTLTASAGLLTASLPNDLLVQAKEALPDQWCMVHCLGYDGRRIEGMANKAYLRWIGDEYVVTTPLNFIAPYACTVAGFEIEPLVKGEITTRPCLLRGDMLTLQITLSVG